MKRVYISALIIVSASLLSHSWGQDEAMPAIRGKGTLNFVPVFTSNRTIGNSMVFQSSSTSPFGWLNLLGVGTQNPGATIDVNVGPRMNAFSLGDPNAGSLLIRDTAPGTIDMATTNAVLTINCCDGGNILMLIQPDGSAPPGKVSIGESDPQNILTIKQGASTAPIADAWTTYSSRRWKTNIQPLQAALPKIEQLRAVSFNWTATGKYDIGVVAEEVAQVVPEAVQFEQNGAAQSVDYGRLTALLVEAVREQQTEIRELRAQIQKLQLHLSNR